MLHTDFQDIRCGGNSGPAYEYTMYRVLSNGYQVIDNKGYDYNYARGVALKSKSGINANAELIATVRRTYANNTVSPFYVYGYAFASEKYDSIPYQRCSFNNPDRGLNETPFTDLGRFKPFRDTLLAPSSYFPDFSLTAGYNPVMLSTDAYIAGLTGTEKSRKVRLQHLVFEDKTDDSVALDYAVGADNITTKDGVALGQELAGGGTSSDGPITYDLPQVAVNPAGIALFYIREYYRSTRVSPITGVAKLTWGAMGRPTGYGVSGNSYYQVEQPVAALDIGNDKGGLIVWKDYRNLPGPYSAENIFMRHLDSLSGTTYTPPLNKIITPVVPGDFAVTINPAVLFGTSKTFSPVEISFNSGVTFNTPAASLLDNNYLGSLVAEVYENKGAARVYNGRAFLNRNISFLSDTLPPNAVIDMKLYFSKQEFDQLKMADPTIKNLSYLAVVHQPNAAKTAPHAYAPVTGEEVLTPIAADTLDGGYSLEIKTKSLGNFFIRAIQSSASCAAGNASFVSDITGTTYQWQVNTGGSDFINISNGGNYSGAGTVNLQISTVPVSYNSYRYRCLVDGTKISNIFYLDLSNRWTGVVNNLWENAANWSCGKVPDATTDVVIKTGTITVNSAAVCGSLSVSTGVNLFITPGFNLKIVH